MATTSDTFIEVGSREPASMTLADLGWLVIGCAVALSLPWVWYDAGNGPRPTYGPWLRFLGLLNLFFDLAVKACLALIPVVLARRARFGGVVQAGEVLVFAGAAPHVTTALHNLPWVSAAWHVEPNPLPPGVAGYAIFETPFWIVKASALAVFALAMTLFAMRRRRGPAWFLAALALIAVFAFDCGFLDMLGQGILPWLLVQIRPGPWGEWLLEGLSDLPQYLLFTTPAVIMIRDRMRKPPGSRTIWVGWTGLALAVGFELANLAELLYADINRPGLMQTSIAAILLHLPVWELLLAGMLSWLIVRRYGPAWRRWLGSRSPAEES